jgi:cell division transport system permease protein
MSSIKTAWQQIRRTPYQAIVAVMAVFSTFFVLSAFTLISLGSLEVIKHFEKAPQVIAFFEKGKDLEEQRIAQIRSNLEDTGRLESFKYVSTKEAEAIYREKNKDDPMLLELVDASILPPSIEISATQIQYLPELKDVLESQSGVEEVVFYEDIVKNLSNWVLNIRVSGMGIISYLLLQSILILMIITAMKILYRKKEIEIMRLLGAPFGFITWPFVFEGMFYGMIGAFLGWGAAYLSLLYATPFIVEWLGEINLLPVSQELMLFILAAELGAGMIIGAISSFFAVIRFIVRK